MDIRTPSIGEKVYTCSIFWDTGSDIWTASFSTREARDAFADEVRARLEKYHCNAMVNCDANELNNDDYLQWIDREFQDEDDEN